MSEFIVRSKGKELLASSEEQLVDWVQRGHCFPGDFVFVAAENSWKVLDQLPLVGALYATKPESTLEKKLIYFWVQGVRPYQSGPITLTQARNKIAGGEWGPSTWIFIEGDREWRQVFAVKSLKELLPPAPMHQPLQKAGVLAAAPVSIPVDAPVLPAMDLSLDIEVPPVRSPKELAPSDSSILLDMNAAVPSGPPPAASTPTGFVAAPAAAFQETPAVVQSDLVDAGIAVEETTKAFSALGLALADSAPPPPVAAAVPAAAAVPPRSPAAPLPPIVKPMAPLPGLPAVPGAGSGNTALIETTSEIKVPEGDDFDGITAEIPTDPIWLVKAGESENVMGPFRFLEIVKYLQEGKLSKNDKISRHGSNRYSKIQQQYEFNVKYTLENVVENGVEKQKIFIRRRHPRVSYITPVQIQRPGQVLQGNCVNISAGGILIEAPKASFALGETLSIRILPGLITQTISCDALVIGKVPKIPPGFALKFKELKQNDREAIDFFVHEALKKEQQRSV